MDITNYIYFTVFFTYLTKAMSFSLTRSLDQLTPASLSQVAGYAEYHVRQYDDDEAESPLTTIANVLAAFLPANNGAVTGVQALGFREGAVNPVVYRSNRVIPGGFTSSLGNWLPTFLTASYSAPTFTFRRKGPRFSLPVVYEDYVSGNLLNADFDTSPLGRLRVPAGTGLLDLINDDGGWDVGLGTISRKTVVRRVPNLAPEGNGVGDRLPSYITDPVSAVISGDFEYSQLVKTQLGRRF